MVMDLNLTNRETASALWVLLVIFFLLGWEKTRKPLIELGPSILKIACSPKLVSVALLALGHVYLGVLFLNYLRFWDFGLLKETILWLLFSGIGFAFYGINKCQPNEAFQKFLKNQLGASVFIAFFLNTYQFGLVGEVIFLGVASFIALILGVAQTSEKYEPVQKVFGSLRSMIGWSLFILLLVGLINEPEKLLSVASLKSFLLPQLLTVWLLPLAYGVSIISRYEQIFSYWKIRDDNPGDLVFYSALWILRTGHLNANRVLRIKEVLGTRYTWAKDHNEMDLMFRAFNKALKNQQITEYADFEWPPSDEEHKRINAFDDYVSLVSQDIKEIVEADVIAQKQVTSYKTGEISYKSLESTLKKQWNTLEASFDRLTDLPPLEVKIRKLDRKRRDYTSSVAQVYHMIVDDRFDGLSNQLRLARLEYFVNQITKKRNDFDKSKKELFPS